MERRQAQKVLHCSAYKRRGVGRGKKAASKPHTPIQGPREDCHYKADAGRGPEVDRRRRARRDQQGKTDGAEADEDIAARAPIKQACYHRQSGICKACLEARRRRFANGDAQSRKCHSWANQQETTKCGTRRKTRYAIPRNREEVNHDRKRD